ncbi:MAG: hypothetical protein ABW140_15445 [Candidatus Sedimenticola sp. 6PFRAG1]
MNRFLIYRQKKTWLKEPGLKKPPKEDGGDKRYIKAQRYYDTAFG